MAAQVKPRVRPLQNTVVKPRRVFSDSIGIALWQSVLVVLQALHTFRCLKSSHSDTAKYEYTHEDTNDASHPIRLVWSA